MDHVAKQFTLIDFLGVFSPGAIMVFAVNSCILDLKAPYYSFFSDNTVTLSIYFLALSYLFGSALHQLGAMLERFLPQEENVYKTHPYKRAIRIAYARTFKAPFPEGDDNQIKAGRAIFRYVQRGDRPQRIILFNAFYTMSRTLIVELLLVMAMLPFGAGDVYTKFLTLCACLDFV